MNIETRIEEFEKQLAKENADKIAAFKKELLKEEDYPKEGTIYFIVSIFGTVKTNWDNCDLDKYRYDTGNFFQTEQEALGKLRWLKIDTKLMRLVKKNAVDKNSFRTKLYFTLLEPICKDIVSHIGEEDLKWYLNQ